MNVQGYLLVLIGYFGDFMSVELKMILCALIMINLSVNPRGPLPVIKN